MDARKCDRCGEFYAQYKGKSYNGDEVNAVKIANDRTSWIATFDLCPTCMDKQIRFLRGAKLAEEKQTEASK